MSAVVEAFLSKLHHPLLASIDLKLDRMERLLGMLGSPQNRLPPVIHVAGTNGKGSLLANLKAIFEAAGLRVHRYTSPHLVHFRERIVLQGKEIDDAYLERLLKHVAPLMSSHPATFFEATTAMAFLAFAERPADVLLLETGVGGRLDATNVIDKPLLTAITPVSLDHCEYLGHTLEKIGGEKAGILKAGVPCVVGRQEIPAMGVIEKRAQELSAPLFRLGQEWSWRKEGNAAIYESALRKLSFAPGLAGNFQYDNAATAIACIDRLPQYNITDTHIAEGLSKVEWPARLQRLGGKYAAMLPGMELWLDGGHNKQGGEVLGEWLGQRNLPVYLICGMVQKKDISAYLEPMAPYVKALFAVTIPEESTSQSPDKIVAAARGLGIEASVAVSVEKALQTIALHAKTPSIVCICGSLYLAGKVLAANGE